MNHPTALATVTIIVDLALFRQMPHGLEALLITRGRPPYEGQLALPGGKLNAADASLEQAILREVREETGLELSAQHLRQVGTYGDIDRDPRGRYVSVLYTVTELLPADVCVHAGDDASAVQWCTPISETLLAFDHRRLIEDAIQYHYNWRARTSPGTHRLNASRQCEIGSEFGERCPLPASWEVNGRAMCEEDIKIVANMNSDNEELLRPALATIPRPWG